jgi:tripartite-type tricarboxylate transporter receptor subunit TctC
MTMIAVANQPAGAETSFKGKTINVYAGGQPGAGVDVFTRTFMPYYARVLPGNPTIVVKNLFGAGGMQGVTYAYVNGTRDGTTMTTMAGGPIQAAAFEDRKLQYDIRKFGWVGSLNVSQSMCFVWATSKFKTVKDMLENQMTVSATGASSNSTLLPIMINRTVGTRMKPIAGYGGAGSVLAVEQQEVDGRCLTLDSLKTTHPDWISQQKIRFLLDAGITPNEELPKGTPFIMDLIKDPKDRQAMKLFNLPAEVTIPFGLAPGTDADAIATHRAAFSRAVKDGKYLAEAKRRKQDISPKSGEQVEAIINELFTAPPDVIARVKTYIKDTSGIGRCKGNLCQRDGKKKKKEN